MVQKYKYRNLARIVVETKTPLAVGSGEKDMITDRVVVRDVNGLPCIPGTAIAGIIRHAIEEKGKVDFFGLESNKKKSGKGSEIIFSSAQIVDENGKVIEGLINDRSSYLSLFDNLPVRQHVCINEKGTAEKHGKFDEEIVKGVRFCFEIELLSKEDNDLNFKRVLNELANDTVRIGGGTRKGFGKIEIVECKTKGLDLSNPDELNAYIEKTSSLNDVFWDSISANNDISEHNAEGWTTYELRLMPDDFFLFASGFGDENVDMTPVWETYFDWSSGKPEKKENAVLIPGSSVKGALSHRVAFHYNKLKKLFVGNPEAKAGVENLAVQKLFGYTRKVKDENGKEKEKSERGNVLISDVIQTRNGEQNKILNHVSIDRFTGGAIDGALFSESVVYGKDITYVLIFKVNNNALADEYREPFEQSLFDIAEGMLPLGGGVNRGHGCFSGKIYKNLNEIKR
jgi:CRISPR/Cas system CSM-associated protein Csm3 (group 7 of RAMP superfamily)